VVAKGGGGLDALGRHTVAALLNSANAEVSYDLSPQEVIDAFNNVYPGSKGDYESLKDQFEGLNEQGCPLDNSDGSNSNNPNNGATMMSAPPPKTSASISSSGGGSFGLWELFGLLALGWRALLRARRRSVGALHGLPSRK